MSSKDPLFLILQRLDAAETLLSTHTTTLSALTGGTSGVSNSSGTALAAAWAAGSMFKQQDISYAARKSTVTGLVNVTISTNIPSTFNTGDHRYAGAAGLIPAGYRPAAVVETDVAVIFAGGTGLIHITLQLDGTVTVGIPTYAATSTETPPLMLLADSIAVGDNGEVVNPFTASFVYKYA